MKQNSIYIKLIAIWGFAVLTAVVSATPVYIGYFSVADGPDWHDNPVTFSAREAAAYKFGGHYTDYAISTSDYKINNMAWVDGWADTQHLYEPVHEDFKLGDYYMDGALGAGAFSAFVTDHTILGLKRVNYVWRLDGQNPVVPEPATLMTLGGGLIGLLATRYRKRPRA